MIDSKEDQLRIDIFRKRSSAIDKMSIGEVQEEHKLIEEELGFTGNHDEDMIKIRNWYLWKKTMDVVAGVRYDYDINQYPSDII